MDIMSMLQNAKVRDMEGLELGEVFGVSIVGGKMMITIDIEITSGFEDDPDGGEEVDVDRDDDKELDNTEEIPKPTPLRAVAGGK